MARGASWRAAPRYPVKGALAPSALPRTKAALEALAALLDESVLDVYRAVGLEQASALDAAVAPHLEAAARAQAEGVLEVLRALPASPAAQKAGGRFVAAACSRHKGAHALLAELGAGELLCTAVRAHPREKGVQDQAQWAVARLLGHRPLMSALQDPELGKSPEVVCGALWCIAAFSGGGHPSSAWEVVAPWEERWQLARLAQAALVTFSGDADLAAHALSVVSTMLNAKLPDAVHARAAEAVQSVLQAMVLYPREEPVQRSAAEALEALVEGNREAVSLLQGHGQEVVALLDSTMEVHSSSELLGSLCRVRCAVHGAAGLLDALATASRMPSPSLQAVQQGLLHCLAKHAEDCDATLLVNLDAVERICAILAASKRAAPAGIAALGRVVEFMIQYMSSPFLWDHAQASAAQCTIAIERGVDVIVTRLQDEIADKDPDVFVYTTALEALRNLSRRSEPLAQRIAACSTLTTAVDMAFEREFSVRKPLPTTHLMGSWGTRKPCSAAAVGDFDFCDP